jgi:NCS1 family nucleobase:cation symporter-1
MNVKELYSRRRDGPYYYTLGINWRAYSAYIAGILINVVGFAGAVGETVPIGAVYIYNLNFFCGFIVSLVVYWSLSKIWPVPETRDRWTEVGSDDELDVVSSVPSTPSDKDRKAESV